MLSNCKPRSKKLIVTIISTTRVNEAELIMEARKERKNRGLVHYFCSRAFSMLCRKPRWK